MKCDKCKAQEATVHEVSIKGGKRVEKHLCEQCAKQEGLPVQSFVGPQQVLQAIVAQQAQAAGGAAGAPGAAPSGSGAGPEACPQCGMKFASFRQSGLLGCAECYAAFASQLSAPLERWHEGGTHHVGKTPRRVRSTETPAQKAAVASVATLAAIEMMRRRVETLRRQLAEAVEGEQYERAAKLRDEIRRIETQDPYKVPVGEDAGEAPPSAPASEGPARE